MNRFVDENGNFKSNYNQGQIGYIEELLEWVFYHDNISIDEKREYLLALEEIRDKAIREIFSGSNVITEKWSDKL